MTKPPLSPPKVVLAAAVCFASLLAPAAALGADDDREARADKLFREAEQLFDAKNYSEACGRFATSNELDPKLGTLLNLAYCHEKMGKFAKARAEFDEALLWALQKGRMDRGAFAREHLVSIEKKLAFVVIEPPITAAPGLEVTLDGEPIPPSRWQRPIPVDPGEHVLLASAPRKEPQPISFVLEPFASTRQLKVPTLLDAPPPPPPPTNAARERDKLPAKRPFPWLKVAGWTALGGGVAALGVGGYFGYRFYSSTLDVRNACATGPCRPGASDSADESRSYGVTAALAVGAGVAVGALGAWLLHVSSPASTPPKTAWTPWVSPTGGGLGATGTF